MKHQNTTKAFGRSSGGPGGTPPLPPSDGPVFGVPGVPAAKVSLCARGTSHGLHTRARARTGRCSRSVVASRLGRWSRWSRALKGRQDHAVGV